MFHHRVSGPERAVIEHAGARIVVTVAPDPDGVWSLRVAAPAGAAVTRRPGAWSHLVRHAGESLRLRLDLAGYGFRREFPTLWLDGPRTFAFRFEPAGGPGGVAAGRDPEPDPEPQGALA